MRLLGRTLRHHYRKRSSCQLEDKIAEQNQVNIVAGPFVNREHTTVVIVETDRSENLDEFLNQTRLPQWNRMHIIPSLHLQEGIRDVEADNSLF